MHKGLKSTLLTVAVALMGFNAMAMAPVIGRVPDVIIGDAGSATPGNDFVYPEAINADTLVTDDVTTAPGIHWSFSNPGDHYQINGRTRTDGAVIADPANPGATYDLTLGDDPDSTDSNTHSFTFRNKFYSPSAGPNTAPPGPGIQDGQVVSLVATDGTTVSLPQSFMVYIDKDGPDRLSGGFTFASPRPYDVDFGTTDGGWIKNTLFIGTGDGSAVTLTSGGNGLCADVSAQGANLAGWASQPNTTGIPANAYHTVSLVDGAVYRLRTYVTTTAQAGLTPLWYIMCENTLSAYGESNDFYDSGTFPTPGLNTPIGTGGGTRQFFETWFAPAAGGTASFKTAMFNTPANAPYKDFRLQFQTLDVGTPGNDPYGGASDAGALCLKKIEIDRGNASDLQVQSTPYSHVGDLLRITTSPNQAANGITVNDFTAGGVSTVTNTGGTINFQPTTTTAWDSQAGGTNAFMQIFPGDATNSHSGGADATDNYPVPWLADQLYRIVWTLTAPSALAETNGVDWIIIGADVDTNEVIIGNYCTTKFGSAAMPKVTPQEYVVFWHGNGGTIVPGFQRMRPYLFTGTNNDFVDTPNQAGIRVDGVRVDQIVTP